MKKKIILCFVNYYLPAYKTGGPVRTVSNFVDYLGNEFDIKIVCLDRDANDKEPFPNIKINQWNNVGLAKVFYASPNKITLFCISEILKKTPHDVLYLNSFFSYGFSILPLIAQYLGLVSKTPCVIGPRGEFSKNALMKKKVKKIIFMHLSTLIGLHKNLYWLASTKYEFNDIKREFSNVAKKIFIARDLTPYFANLKKKKLKKREKTFFKIIFLSRISPMKNLDFLIKVLSRVKKNIVFNIYGPKEDLKYWKKCQILLANLPMNIKVNIHDAIPNEKVINIFSQNDLFVFPTQGEAFGHIILEALLAATPVLLSDQTPWQTDKDKGLQIIPLYEDHWLNEINKYIEIPKREFILRRRAAYNYAKRVFLENLKSINDNKKLFYKAIMENY